jgi:hypothetical protein
MSKPKKHSKKPGAEKTATGPGKRGRKRKGMCLEDRPMLEANAAGIDIGAREIFVAVPPDRDEHPVRVFSTFTEDLERGVPQKKAAAARIGRPTVNSESRLCQKLCGIALSSVPRAHWARHLCRAGERSLRNAQDLGRHLLEGVVELRGSRGI